jgi:hypothetical protein
MTRTIDIVMTAYIVGMTFLVAVLLALTAR